MKTDLVSGGCTLGVALLVALNAYNMFFLPDLGCRHPSLENIMDCVPFWSWGSFLDGFLSGADLITALAMIRFMPASLRSALRRLVTA